MATSWVGLNWGFGDGQAGPCLCMGRCMACCMAWLKASFRGLIFLSWCMCGGDYGDVYDVVGVGKMHGYTTWIGEAGLEPWWRSGW